MAICSRKGRPCASSGTAAETVREAPESPRSLLRLSAECAVATSHTYTLCAQEWGKTEAGGDQAAVVAVGHGVQIVVCAFSQRARQADE